MDESLHLGFRVLVQPSLICSSLFALPLLNYVSLANPTFSFQLGSFASPRDSSHGFVGVLVLEIEF
jgi:hypothetical protein